MDEKRLLERALPFLLDLEEELAPFVEEIESSGSTGFEYWRDNLTELRSIISEIKGEEAQE